MNDVVFTLNYILTFLVTFSSLKSLDDMNTIGSHKFTRFVLKNRDMNVCVVVTTTDNSLIALFLGLI